MKERLLQQYLNQRPDLMREMGLKNLLAVPRVEKILVSSGIGKFKDDPKSIESVAADLKTITGQSPKITKAKVAISAFKIKAGDVVGLIVTLRGERLWSFLDKIISVVLPRVKDFHGISPTAFDGSGNLSFGFNEHTVFPEIDVNRVDRPKSLGVTVVTSAGSDERGFLLLSRLGFPFKKEGLKR